MTAPELRRPLDGALWALAQGWKVFPVKAGGKAPMMTGWQDWASKSTAEGAQQFARANPTTNWGIACAQSGLLVVDLDDNDGKRGTPNWQALCAQHGGAPLTMEARTARGGTHLIYQGAGPNSASALAQDVDTRGQGGLIVCPGSVLRDPASGQILGQYAVREARPVATAPQWLLDLLKTAKKEPLKRPDDSEVVGSIPDGQRDNTLARWAGVLRGQGLVHDELLAALLEINRQRCNPPMEDAEVQRIAGSISRKPRGVAEAIAGFAAVSAIQAALTTYSGQAILEREIPPPEELLEGFADIGDICAIFAKSKSRKSWFALQLAICLATGRPFLGWKVAKPIPVLLAQTEVKRDHYERRVQRVAKGLGVTDLSNLRVLHGRGLGLKVEQIANEVKAHESRALVLDPIYPLIEGEENAAEGFKPLLRALAELAEARVFIGYVHHDKKGKSGDVDLVDRGSGSGIVGRAYDNALFLDNHDSDPALQVLRSISRNYPPSDDSSLRWENFAFELDANAPTVETSGSAQARAKRGRPAEELAEQAKHVLEARKEWPRLRAETTLQNALAIGERKARDILHHLGETGFLTPESGAHGAKVYAVNPKASEEVDIFS